MTIVAAPSPYSYASEARAPKSNYLNKERNDSLESNPIHTVNSDSNLKPFTGQILNLKPFIGQIFESAQNAKLCIDSYAKTQGFKVRIGKNDKKEKKVTIECIYARKPTESLLESERQTDKVSIRCKCEYRVNLRYNKDGSLRVTTIKEEHNNHKIITDLKVLQYESTSRKLTPPMKELIKELVQAKTPVASIKRILLNRFREVMFTDYDIYNEVQKHRKIVNPKETDAGNLVQLLSKKQCEEGYFFRFQLHENNQLQYIFWCSPDQIALYQGFSDVVIHDNTYKTNKWNMPLGVFTVIDEFNRSRIVGTCLAVDESQEAYEWAYSKLLEATSKEPGLLFTDCDIAVEGATHSVFPKSKHRWCLWHLQQNLTRHASSNLGPLFQSFLVDFAVCRKAPTEDKFNEKFKKLVEDYPALSSYLEDFLYVHADKWASYSDQLLLLQEQKQQAAEKVNMRS
jgi:hypothetical protein